MRSAHQEGTNKMKEEVPHMFITCTLGSLTSLSQSTLWVDAGRGHQDNVTSD